MVAMIAVDNTCWITQARMNPRKLRRGMWVQFPDGSTYQVSATFRMPANTKWRKKGCYAFQTSGHLWAFLTPDVKVLGFKKP